ncbi:hypothetical protein [Phnomibacter sp. MR]|uniref:hypothetical protein n=1 Tax=Phnomibacter sp. MR TaxID=3042318 RepID=UPI003A80D0FC
MLISNNRMPKYHSLFLRFALLLLTLVSVAEGMAQVSAVQFGKNRIQYRKYNWRFYQTDNFNIHFTEGGLELAKYVLQVAEEELPQLEAFTEIAMQRRANVVLYNSYDDAEATNIGLENAEADPGGMTRLVNNKMILYFNGNHADLRRQIRQGIARILVDNRLFGENLGEVASNAALLDLPKWLTDGYVAYAAENWSIERDDELKNALLANEYKNFYALAFDRPQLAGQAFFHYLANTYKKENVTYFLYLSILYKNTNNASLRICRKKLKDVLKDMMEQETEKYYADIRGRRNYPKGSIAVTEDINKDQDFYHFAANPNARSYTYAVAEYKKGFYNVSLYENFVNRKVLIKSGIRTYKHERNPVYPVMSWDGKGSRLAVIYWEKDKVKLMIYDLVNASVTKKVDLPFDQVQDAQYFLDHKRLILSAVKNGHTDIFVYNIETAKVEQITNDVWDDVDASFVSFPNKYGIIFSSNRPTATTVGADTSLPSDYRYNVFLADVDDKGGFRQITQLSNLQFGNARYPTQYNMNHFTFVSDESGVANRYAGFFTTKAEGLDTLVIIGDEILRNPSLKEVDSTLKAWDRSEPDSIGLIALTKDSTYTFPITNYQSSLLESRIAGDKGQVTEVTQQSGLKMLYRLRVDSVTLRKRNVSARPTDYVKEVQTELRREKGTGTLYQTAKEDSTGDMSFLGEFVKKNDSITKITGPVEVDKTLERKRLLESAKLYKYKLRFIADVASVGVTNTMVLTRYQPYLDGIGPVQLNNGNNLSWLLMASLSDEMEDYRISGGMKPGINLTDNEFFIDFQNRRKRIDWGAMYYRARNSNTPVNLPNSQFYYPGVTITNLYQGNVTYPLDRVRSIRVIGGVRFDRVVMSAVDRTSLRQEDENLEYANLRAEYVHDNSLLKTSNIWNGLRWKVYMETIMGLQKSALLAGQRETNQFTYNMGADFRYYVPIYRNFIWAVRGAADISWGNQKLIYYLGGADGWISPKFNNANRPTQGVNYLYQTLAVNLRGYQQNVANGNNAVVINSEFRLPVFSTFFNKPINNAFLRNFQLIQFFDLGSAWEGTFKGISRPNVVYGAGDPNNPVRINIKAGGIGPFVGGYGFGARSTLLGYFLKVDAGWPMGGFFKGKPAWYFALGFDF